MLIQHTPQDGKLRRRRNDQALRILVVASYNSAVDNIMERVHTLGIPDGNGGVIHPKMCRIARHDYVPRQTLGQYLIRAFAANYDGDNRATPSLRARRQVANECVIFFSTSSAAGSSQLKELNQWFDVVIHDEAGNSLEGETLVPLTAACTHRDLGFNRLFNFGIGDEKQLPALSLVTSMLSGSRVVGQLPFDMKTINRSMFERLIYNNRTSFYFLDSQFRMHPAISRTTSPPFYNYFFRYPVPEENFTRIYTRPKEH